MIRLTLDLRTPKGANWWKRIAPAATEGRWYRNGMLMGWSEIRTQLQGLRVLLLICGYNSPEDGATASYETVLAGITRRMEFDAVIFVQWPTSTKAAFWWAQIKVYAEKFINGVGKELREALIGLPYASLVCVGHSLGCGVLCDANESGELRIDQLVLTNPAISAGSFALPRGKFLKAIQGVRRVLVFHSRKDGAGVAYKLSSLGLADMMGRVGPVPEFPSNVRVVDLTEEAPDHSDARKVERYYEEIAGGKE